MSGGLITTGNGPSALKPLVFKYWEIAAKETPEIWKQVFETVSVKDKYEIFQTFMPMGAAVLQDEGEGVSYDTMKHLYRQVVQVYQYGAGYKISQIMLEDGHYFRFTEHCTRGLRRGYNTTMNTLCADRLNNITSTAANYVGPDGVAIGSASHPLADGSVQSNILATAADLDEAPLEALLIQMMYIKDWRGNKRDLNAKQLIVPPDSIFLTKRLLGSDLRPGSADNDINALKALGFLQDKPVVWKYLNDTDAWYIQTDAEDGAMVLERLGLEFGSDKEFDTDNARFKMRFRMGATIQNPFQFFSSVGA